MSSILETFYILFKSDASDVKKGHKEAQDATDKLAQSLKLSDANAKKFTSSLEDLARQLSEIILSYLSLDTLFNGMRSAEQYAGGLFELGRELATNTEQLDEWGKAVEKTGGSAQEFAGTLRSLDRSLAQVSIYGMSQLVPQLARLGIRVRDNNGDIKSAIGLLPELANAFQHLTRQEALAVGSEMNLGVGLIQLLRKGPEAVAAALEKQRSLGVTSAESAEKAYNFKVALQNVAQAFNKLFENINDKVLPILTKFLESLTDVIVFLQSHSTVVVGAITAITAALTLALIPALLSITAMLAPWLAFVGIFGAIGVAVGFIIEEFNRLSEGSETVTSHYLKNWLSTFTNLNEAITGFGGAIAAFWKTIEEMVLGSDILGYIKTILHWLDAGHQKLNDFHNASQGFKLSIPFFNDMGNNPVADVHTAMRDVNALPNSIINNSTSNAENLQTRSITVNTGPITITSQATDADGIASDFTDVLNNRVSQILNQYNSGVVG